MATAQPLSMPRDEIHDILVKTLYAETHDKSRKARRRTVILVGPPGTGKTTLFFDVAKDPHLLAQYNELTGLELESIPVYVTNCHPDATAPEVIAQYLPLNGVWTYIPQSMLRAWGYGWDIDRVLDKSVGIDEETKAPPPGIHLLDDIHLMGPGGQSAMYRAFDTGYGGSILDPFGHLFFPHEAALSGGTMNGDVDSLDPAVVDRTEVKMPVFKPSADMLDYLDPEMRALCDADYTDNPDPIATYREWRSMSDLRPLVGLEKATLLALGKPERSYALLEAMAELGITEAVSAVKRLASTKPV